MPTATLEKFGSWSDLAEAKLIRRLHAVAKELRVTASALRWRLVALGKLKPAAAQSLPESALRNNRPDIAENVPPALFSRTFMEVLGLAIERGCVSVRSVASLLELNVEDLADLFAAHDVRCAIDL
jgi:hypothetical protein